MTTRRSSIDKIVERMPLSWLPLPTTLITLSDIAQQLSNNDVSSFDQEWQNLRFMPWRFFYLDYLHLNQEINSTSHNEGDMLELIQLEWNKVYDFYMLKLGEIERKIDSYYHIKQEEEQLRLLVLDVHHLYHFSKLNYSGFLRLFMQYDRRLFGSNNSDLLRRMLINKSFWDHSIVLFNLVSQLNYLFCIDLPTMLNPPPLPSESFFSAVESFQQQRRAVHPLSISSSSSSSTLSCETALSHPQEQELPKHSKKVKKYWIHPDNILEVVLFLSSKKMMLQHEENNPSCTFTAVEEIGHPQGLKSTFIAKSPTSIHHVPIENTTGKKRNCSKSKVTTVYLDTPDLNDYTERIVKNKEGGGNTTTTTTRVRWFNDKLERQEGFSLLEEKVYYNNTYQAPLKEEGYKCLGKKPQQQRQQKQEEKVLSNTTKDWIKQRIWLKSKHLKSWINGNWSLSNTLDKSTCQYRIEGLPVIHAYDDKQRMKNACLQTERDIHNKLKVPVLKTTHSRSVYISHDKEITIAIDTDITMMRPMDTFKETEIKMTKSNLRQHEHEHYPYYTTQHDNNIHRFPFCLIHIESNEQQQDIDWLTKLESSPLLEPVHDFSLYLHGVGTLLSNQVHVFPTWLSKIEFLDIRQSTLRGNLFIEQQVEVEPVAVVLESNSSDEAHYYWSSNTIATIVTFYNNEEDEGYVKSSSSSVSSLLSPQQYQLLPDKFRRSFDSYCSFDHPTSSKSDPTNCKSCMDRIINSSDNSMNIIQKNNNVDCPTLYSVVRDAFKHYFGNIKGEKEPLLLTHSHSTHYVTAGRDSETGNNNTAQYQSLKASMTTAFLIISSLSVSYLFYVSFLKK